MQLLSFTRLSIVQQVNIVCSAAMIAALHACEKGRTFIPTLKSKPQKAWNEVSPLLTTIDRCGALNSFFAHEAPQIRSICCVATIKIKMGFFPKILTSRKTGEEKILGRLSAHFWRMYRRVRIGISFLVSSSYELLGNPETQNLSSKIIVCPAHMHWSRAEVR